MSSKGWVDVSKGNEVVTPPGSECADGPVGSHRGSAAVPLQQPADDAAASAALGSLVRSLSCPPLCSCAAPQQHTGDKLGRSQTPRGSAGCHNQLPPEHFSKQQQGQPVASTAAPSSAALDGTKFPNKPSESISKQVPKGISQHFQPKFLMWSAVGIAVLAIIYTMWVQTKDCEGHWVDMPPCSASCGEGVMKIRFNITSLAKNGGQACPAFDNRPCNQFPCPTNCQLSKWTAEPDGCSTSCGGGVLREVRTIQRAASHGGHCPDPSSADRERTTSCNNHPCPVDCELSDWTTDEAGCSKFCGNGTARQVRPVNIEAKHGGSCPEPASDLRQRWVECNTERCIEVAVVQEVQEGLAQAAGGLVDAAVAVQEMEASGDVLLRHYPRFNCSAGIASNMSEAAAVCDRHNVLAQRAVDMKRTLNNASDQCKLLKKQFDRFLAEMRHSLPYLVWRACSNDWHGANSTLSTLLKHVKALKDQRAICAERVQDLRAQGDTLIPEHDGHKEDNDRRADALLEQIQQDKVALALLSMDADALAASAQQAKENTLAKQAELQQAEDDRRSLRAQQRQRLEQSTAAALGARAKSDEANRKASDLETSAEAKNSGVKAEHVSKAKAEAAQAAAQAEAKEQQHARKVDEYNMAVNAEEAALKRLTDGLHASMQKAATSEDLEQEKRAQAVQAGQTVGTRLLDYKNVRRTAKMAQFSHPGHLVSILGRVMNGLTNLEALFTPIRDFLSQLRDEEGRMSTGQSGCIQTKHIVANIVNAVMTQ